MPAPLNVIVPVPAVKVPLLMSAPPVIVKADDVGAMKVPLVLLKSVKFTV